MCVWKESCRWGREVRRSGSESGNEEEEMGGG